MFQTLVEAAGGFRDLVVHPDLSLLFFYHSRLEVDSNQPHGHTNADPEPVEPEDALDDEPLMSNL